MVSSSRIIISIQTAACARLAIVNIYRRGMLLVAVFIRCNFKLFYLESTECYLKM